MTSAPSVRPSLPRLVLPWLLAAAAQPVLARPAASFALRCPAGAPVAQDDAEEDWRLIQGLVERDLHEQVVREATRFLERHRRSERAPDVRYRLAGALFELGRTADARGHYRDLRGREDFRYRSEVLFRLGQCELALDEPARAAAALEPVAEGGPDYLRTSATYLWGEALFRTGDAAGARTRFEAVVGGEDSTHHADALHGLAWCGRELGDAALVATCARRFAREHPDDERGSELFYLAGEAQLAAGDAAAAREAFGRVGAGPHQEAALRGLGFAAAEQGDREAAVAAFALLLERFPEGEHTREAALHLGIHRLSLEGPAAALATWRAHDPGDDPLALRWRARAEVEAGEPEAALATLDRALEARPDAATRAELLVVRGECLAALGRDVEAARDWERAGTPWALHAAAVSHLNRGEAERALALVDALEAAGALDEGSDLRGPTLLVRAEALFAREPGEAADAAYAALLEAGAEGTTRARATLRRGWCHWLAGDVEGATPFFRAAAEERGDHDGRGEARFLNARCAERLGDAAGARAAFARYLEQHPDGEHVAEAGLRLGLLLEGEPAEQRLRATADAHAGDPFGRRARFELAERLSARGEHAAAAEAYAAVLEQAAGDDLEPHAAYGLGWCLWSAGEAEAAADALWRAAEDEQAGLAVPALELCVWAERKAGRPQRAREAFVRFAGLTQDTGRRQAAAREASAALVEAGDVKGAVALWDALLRSAPDDGARRAAAAERVHLALEGGDVDGAEALLEGVVRQCGLDEGLCEASFFVGDAREGAGQLDAATRHFARAARGERPELVERALYRQGFALLAAEDADGAAQALTLQLERFPKGDLAGESLFLLGEAHYRAGRMEQAEPPLALVVREHPRHAVRPKALFRLGLVRGELERWEGCAQVLNELVAKHADFPNRTEAELWRGHALAALGQGRAARAAYGRVLEGDRGVLSARAHLGLGRLSEAEGARDDALSAYLKVAVLYDAPAEVAEALWRGGEVLVLQGDLDRAREMWREAVDDHPDTPAAATAARRLAETADDGGDL